MMLCKLSIANLRKSLKDYTIYFVTLIIGVCIFYIFNSIDSQTAYLNVSKSTYEIIELIKSLMSGLSIFIAFVLGFLIIYASRFLIKKRNKEIGIYMILGIPKRKISKMLLIETFLIGIVSLGIGLILGVCLSQLTSIFIAKLFDTDMTQFVFNFSLSSFIKTIIYFAIIYIVVMIFNTIIINRCKLIDLLNKNKKSEKIKFKNPILCVVIFIISLFILGYAYYMVTGGFYKMFSNKPFSYIIIPIIMGILGTLLFFYSLSGMFLRIISKIKRVYYKKLNTFVYKEIGSEINTMVVSISIICIMIFVTTCVLSSALSIKNYFNKSIYKYAPVDFMIQGKNSNDNEKLSEIIYNNDELKDNIKDVLEFNIYKDDNFTYKDSLGSYYTEIMEKYPNVAFDANTYIMSNSDYNKMAGLYNLQKVTLNDNEYSIVCNYECDIYNNVLENNTKYIIFKKELVNNSNKVVDGFYEISESASNIGFVVVPDSIINTDYIRKVLIGNYTSNDKSVIERLDNNIRDETENIDIDYITYDTKSDIKESSVGLSAMTTFIGLYIGIIFLISSSLIISLKSLSDAIDDKAKYQILRNIGTEEKYINKCLFKQILILFMLPLLLSVVHTIFGIKFCLLILESIGIINMSRSIITAFIFILAIYGCYFLITYMCSKNIIKES